MFNEHSMPSDATTMCQFVVLISLSNEFGSDGQCTSIDIIHSLYQQTERVARYKLRCSGTRCNPRHESEFVNIATFLNGLYYAGCGVASACFEDTITTLVRVCSLLDGS